MKEASWIFKQPPKVILFFAVFYFLSGGSNHQIGRPIDMDGVIRGFILTVILFQAPRFIRFFKKMKAQEKQLKQQNSIPASGAKLTLSEKEKDEISKAAGDFSDHPILNMCGEDVFYFLNAHKKPLNDTEGFIGRGERFLGQIPAKAAVSESLIIHGSLMFTDSRLLFAGQGVDQATGKAHPTNVVFSYGHDIINGLKREADHVAIFTPGGRNQVLSTNGWKHAEAMSLAVNTYLDSVFGKR